MKILPPQITSDAVAYLPDILGNREKKASEQCVFWLLPMSKEESDKSNSSASGKTTINQQDPMASAHARQQKLDARILRDRIERIENLFEEGPGGETIAIKTGGQFYNFINKLDVALGDEFAEEIIEAIRNHSRLSDGLRKNFESQSDSSPINGLRKSERGDVTDVAA